MTDPIRAETGCLLVGEDVDEAECPPDFSAHRSEVVRPQVVANCVDFWDKQEGLKEFTVLLKDGRVVSVRGQSVKHLPPSNTGGDDAKYSIIIRTGGEEVLVALFQAMYVIGIFHGELLSDRKIG